MKKHFITECSVCHTKLFDHSGSTPCCGALSNIVWEGELPPSDNLNHLSFETKAALKKIVERQQAAAQATLPVSEQLPAEDKNKEV